MERAEPEGSRLRHAGTAHHDTKNLAVQRAVPVSDRFTEERRATLGVSPRDIDVQRQTMSRAIGEDEVTVLDEWSFENEFLPPCEIESMKLEREEVGYGRAELCGCHRAEGTRDFVRNDERPAEISQCSDVAGREEIAQFRDIGCSRLAGLPEDQLAEASASVRVFAGTGRDAGVPRHPREMHPRCLVVPFNQSGSSGSSACARAIASGLGISSGNRRGDRCQDRSLR